MWDGQPSAVSSSKKPEKSRVLYERSWFLKCWYWSTENFFSNLTRQNVSLNCWLMTSVFQILFWVGTTCTLHSFPSLSPSLSQSHEPPTGHMISNSSQELPPASFSFRILGCQCLPSQTGTAPSTSFHLSPVLNVCPLLPALVLCPPSIISLEGKL